jgi:hypothetical protein
VTVRTAWLLPGGTGPGQTREDTRHAPLGAMTPAGELASRPGVIPGGNPFAAVGAGAMSLQVGVGRAVVQGTLAQGAYPVAVDAPETVTFADGDAQFARIDTVVLRVYDGLYDTSGQTLARIEIIGGAPSDTPVAPSVGNAALPLWNVTVPAGTSAGAGGIDWTSALFDRRKYTVAVGGIVPRGALADTGAYDGQYRDAGGELQRWDAAGAVWRTYRPPVETTETVTAGLTMSGGWALRAWTGRRRHGICTVKIEARRTGAAITANAAGNITDSTLCTIPSGWRPAEPYEAVVSDGYGSGTALIETGGAVRIRTWSGGGTIDDTQDNTYRVTATYILP